MRFVLRGALLALCSSAALAQVPLTGGTYTQDFDTLVNTGSASQTTLPAGWLMHESSGNTDYNADNGGSNSGNTYSYGSTGSNDRALGTLLSGSNTPTIGARFVNNTGTTLTELRIGYTGEQWRIGTTGSVDRLEFEYSLNATAVNDTAATWTKVPALHVTSRLTTPNGPLDGNQPANRVDLTADIASLNIANGSVFYIRWIDINATGGMGNDDGLAIDNFSIGPAADLPPQLTGSTPVEGANPVPVGQVISLQFSEAVTTATPNAWYTLDCAGPIPATASGSGNTRQITPGAPLPFSTLCTLTLDATAIEDSANQDLTGTSVITFTTAADAAPNVATIVPANAATNVAPNTNVTLTFSEPVQTLDPWFTLDCGSGAVVGILSGTGATRSFDPTPILPSNTLCVVALDETRITDLDGVAQTLVGDHTFSFTTRVDNAPTVQTITPAHNASNVALDANIVIAFSEDVTPTDPWIALACTISGAHPGSITGAGSSWQFDPSTNFAFDDVCTLTLTAANIADQDGTPQTLSGQASFQFNVRQDLAPTIASTFPADNATNVPVGSNLTVTFSEPVTALSGAFAIACGATVHPFGESNVAQTTYTLDPATNFAEGADCTLTITASHIQDTDGTPNALAAGAVIDFRTSAGVSGYYERVDTSSCRALRATLHGTIDDHVSVSYTPVGGPNNDTWDILEYADEDPVDTGMILDAYHNRKYTKVTDRSGPQASTHYNREHTWPNSLGFPDTTGDMGLPNAPYTDTHMLYLTDSLYNLHRSNDPYRVCAGCTVDATIANYGVGGGGDDNRYNGSAYEVWSKRKGDMARAVLYMDFRYEGGTNSITNQSEPDLVLTYGSDSGTPGSLDTLLAWHNADPPSNPNSSAVLDNIEVRRNNRVQEIQKNRNPLIDHPEWAAILFESPCNGPAVVAVDDDFTMPQDTTLTRGAPGVLRDDRNGVSKNGQGLTATLVVQAQHGTATITNGATGAFTYVPTAGYHGEDSFTYQVTNGTDTDQAVVHIVVTSTTPDNPPTAVADTFNVIEDSGANTLAVLANDTDTDGGPKQVVSTTQPSGGSVTIGGGGANVVFTPNANVCAATSFTYTLNGGSQNTVSITMTCANDAPNAVGSIGAQTWPIGVAVALGTSVRFADIDGDTLAYSATGLPASLSIDPVTGLISGTPQASDAGSHNIVVTARDPSNATATQSFTAQVPAAANAIFLDGFE